MVHRGPPSTHIPTSVLVRSCLQRTEIRSSWHQEVGGGSQNTAVNHTGIQIQGVGFSWDAAGPGWDFRNGCLSLPCSFSHLLLGP